MNQKNWIVISKVFQIYDRSDTKEAQEEKNQNKKDDLQFQKKIIAKMKLRIEQEKKEKAKDFIRLSFGKANEILVYSTQEFSCYQIFYSDEFGKTNEIQVDVQSVNLKSASFFELLAFLVLENTYELKNISVNHVLESAFLIGESIEYDPADLENKKDYLDIATSAMWKQYKWNHLEAYLALKAYVDTMA